MRFLLSEGSQQIPFHPKHPSITLS